MSRRWGVVGAVATLALAGCGGSGRADVKAAFSQSYAFQAAGPAFTYDAALVPAGSGATASVWTLDANRTKVQLEVRGLQPKRAYGAHAHVGACSADPAAAGPHYQNVADPVKPSVDPKYSNPQNEVWLDFTTDDKGNAKVTSTVNWRFREGGAKSIVIHKNATATHAGHAGTAGARIACVNVTF